MSRTARSFRRGTIRKLPSGRFQVRVSEGTDDLGRQRQLPLPGATTFSKRIDAVKALDAYLARRDSGALSSPHELQLGNWLSQVLETRRSQQAASTHANYAHMLERHILPALGQIKLQALKPSHLRAFYTNLAERGYSRSLLGSVW